MASRALPDLTARVRIDTTQLKGVGPAGAAAGKQLESGLAGGTRGATAAESAFGRLYVRLGQLGPVGATVSSRLDQMGLGAASAGEGLATMGAAAAAVGAVMAVKIGIDAANAYSDLNEQISASQQLFGQASADVVKFGQNAALHLGISETESIRATASFGALFQSVGATSDQSAKMGEQFVSLAADLASFYNISESDALDRLKSGLVGQYDTLRELNIVLDDNTVRQYAVQQGWAATTGEVTQQQKVMATYQLILEQTTKAQGDAGRTSNSLANQQRILSQNVQDLQLQLGALTIGPMAAAIQDTNILLTATSRLASGTQGLSDQERALSGVLQFLSPIVTQFTDAIGLAHQGIQNLGNALGITKAQHQDYSAVQARATAATKDMQQATDQLNQALLRLPGTEVAVEQAQQRLTEAQHGTTDAQNALNEAIAQNGPTSAEAQAASDRLKDAELGEKQAAIDLASQTVQLQVTKAQLAGQTLSAEQQEALFKQALQEVANTLAPGSSLRNALEGYIGELHDVPSEVRTTVITSYVTEGEVLSSAGAGIITARQGGGPIVAGRPYLVGEHGPELVVPQMSGDVIPADATAALMRYQSSPWSEHGGGAAAGGMSATINVAHPVDEQELVRKLDWYARTGNV